MTKSKATAAKDTPATTGADQAAGDSVAPPKTEEAKASTPPADPYTAPAEPAKAPETQDQPKPATETAVPDDSPPARLETVTTTRSDGVVLRIRRNIDTGEQTVLK